MSLVGTRPPTLDEWEKYEPHHRARMSFRYALIKLCLRAKNCNGNYAKGPCTLQDHRYN